MGVGTKWGPTLASSATFNWSAMGDVVDPYRVEGVANVTELHLGSLVGPSPTVRAINESLGFRVK